MSAEARETAPEAAIADLAPAAAAGPSPGGAFAGLAPQQRLALQLQGAGGNAGVARMLRQGVGTGAAPLAPPSAPSVARYPANDPFGPVVARQPAGPTVARDPAAAPAAAAAPPGSAAPPGAAVDTSLVPDFVLDMIRAIPGYGVASLVAGVDPLTGAPVRLDRKTLVEQLLGHGPFAAGIGPVLSTLDVLDEVFGVISDGLASHQLTMSRVWADITAAWEEVSVTNAPSTNVAIVERYLTRFIADVGAFASEIADQLITMVREAAVDAAEPFLQRPEIAPVWNLARKVMHYDPLRDESVDAPTVEILADFMRLIGQEQRLAQMQERGTLQKTADWLDTQAHTFLELLSQLKSLFTDAWNAISPANLPNLIDSLKGLADRALGLMRGVRAFATEVIGTVLRLIKDALLGLLSEHAHKVPGFHLVTVILGRNPFTDEAVPRTPQNLIRGFISLLPGGEAIYDQLAESGVIASAAARIEGAIDRLGISWDLITGTFRGIWDTLSLDDLLNPIGAFARIIDKFGEPLARIVAFVGEVVQAVVELILAAMNFPGDLMGSIIDNAKRAMDDIKKDPVQFLKNVLMALKDGVSGFLSNIVGYLRDGLVGWLTHGLKKVGVEIPTEWSLGSVVKLVMDVLGIGIEKLWEKLAKKTSPGIVAKIKGGIDKLAGAWEWVKDVMENGISALWKHLQDQLGNLWDTLLGMAKDWIMGELIEKALARLVSMLDPTGIMAIIRSAQAFFNAIQSAIEYLRDILAIVNDYVSTLAAVAAGNISAGASKLEKGLAKGIPIALGFLANQVGITDVPEKIAEIIGKLRETIDKALDWLVDKAWEMGKAALSALGIGGKDDPDKKDDEKKEGEPDPIKSPFQDEEEASHNVVMETGAGGEPELNVHSVKTPFDKIVEKLRGEIESLDPDGEADGAPSPAELKKKLDALVQSAKDTKLTQEAKELWKNPTEKAGSVASLGSRINNLASQLGEITKGIRARNKSGDPEKSADGIGNISKHGAQKSSLRTGHPLHWMTSEHILPFALGAQIWRLLEQELDRKIATDIDKEQVTIMIYSRAAEVKTAGDNPATEEAKEDFAELIEQVEDEEISASAGRSRAATLLNNAHSEAVARTISAVKEESEQKIESSKRTNAERRGKKGSPEAPTPSKSDIKDAAGQQLSSLVSLFQKAVEQLAAEAAAGEGTGKKKKPAGAGGGR
ncbi:MAG: hypothetical protein J7513_11495 [Solirubrobacteraceae bacterium]|nr:hypothetical protein [Solirubrobacteraceae bacterium]